MSDQSQQPPLAALDAGQEEASTLPVFTLPTTGELITSNATGNTY